MIWFHFFLRGIFYKKRACSSVFISQGDFWHTRGKCITVSARPAYRYSILFSVLGARKKEGMF